MARELTLGVAMWLGLLTAGGQAPETASPERVSPKAQAQAAWLLMTNLRHPRMSFLPHSLGQTNH